LQTAFSIEHNSVRPTPVDVFGIISMVFWSIAILVSVESVALVMRADRAVRRGSPRPLCERRAAGPPVEARVELHGVGGDAL
jgi:KUP system potassium uptake protein